MKLYSKIRHILMAALLLTGAATAAAQSSIALVNEATLEHDANCGTSLTITDDGGAAGDYSNGFNGAIHVTWSAGTELHLHGHYNVENYYDKIYLTTYEGSTTEYSGAGEIDITLNGGELTLRFTTDGSVVREGFELTCEIDGSGATTCSNEISNLTATLTSDGSIDLSWDATDAEADFVVYYDGTSITTSNTSATLSGLGGSMMYKITVADSRDNELCCAATTNVRTGCAELQLPFTESFEYDTVGAMPQCWLWQANFDNSSLHPQVTSDFAADGSNSLMLSSGNDASRPGHYALVATPPIANTTGSVSLKINLMALYYGTNLVVGTLPADVDDYDTSAFQRIETISLDYYGTYTWNEHTITWDYSSERSRLALMLVQGEQTVEDAVVYIDYAYTESCANISANVSQLRDTSLILEWEGTTTATVGLRHSYNMHDIRTYTDATSPLLIGGLDPNTSYVMTIYHDCDSRGTSISVRTDKAPIQAESFCDFENTNMPKWILYGDNNCLSWSHNDNNYNFHRYCHNDNDSLILVSPRMQGLTDKYLSIGCSFYTYWATGIIVVGTMDYPDMPETFHPIDTLSLNQSNTDIDTLFVVHIPSTVSTSSLALRVECDVFDIKFKSLTIGSQPRINLRQAHAYGDTLIELRWDNVEPTVVVEYTTNYYTDWVNITHRDTVYNTDRALLHEGLYPNSWLRAFAHRPGEELCLDILDIYHTLGETRPFPLCNDISDDSPTPTSQQWEFVSPNDNSTPTFTTHPYYYEAGLSLSMSSFGTAGEEHATVLLPDVQMGSNAYLSFYASAMVDTSHLIVGTYTYHNPHFIAIDTIDIGFSRRHYTLPLPDDTEGRLALRWYHEHEYTTANIYIDELILDTTAYGTLTYTVVDSSEVTFSLDNLTHADSVLLILHSTDHDTTLAWVPGSGDLNVGNLRPGTLYTVHLAVLTEQGSSCQSYAGYFITTAYGVGIERCFNIADRLSYEIPDSWTFTDPNPTIDDDLLHFTGMAVLPLSADGAPSFFLIKGDADTLFFGYTTDSVNFITTDTICTQTSTISLAGLPADGWLAIMTPDGATAAIAVAGYFDCPIVDFKPRGNTIVCTMRDTTIAPAYDLTLQTSGGISLSYYVTTSPFTIEGLEKDADYTISYSCHNGITACTPTIPIHTDASITAPVCFNFNTMPTDWDFIIPTGRREPELLTNGSWHFFIPNNIYAVLPDIYDTGLVSVYGYISNSLYYGQEAGNFFVGTIDQSLDTNTFVPVPTVNNFRNDGVFSATIPHLGNRRIAIRSGNCYGLYVGGISVDTMTAVRYSTIAYRTVRITPDVDTCFRTAYRYDNYSTPTAISSCDSIYDFVSDGSNEWIHFYQNIFNCPSNAYTTLWLGTSATLPLCTPSSTMPSNFYQWKRLYNNDYYTAINFEYYYPLNMEGIVFTNTNYDNAAAYLVLPDFNADSVQQLYLNFDFMSEWEEDTLLVGVMTDLNDTATFVPTDTAVYTVDGGLQAFSTSFASYTGQGRWIAICHRGQTASAGYSNEGKVFIDALSVNTCNDRLAQAATIELSAWNVATINSIEPGFFAEYGLSSHAEPDTAIYIDHLPYNITLDTSTTYNFCFRCDTATEVCTSQNFTIATHVPPVDLPLCLNFDTLDLGHQLNDWYITPHNEARLTVSDLYAHSDTKSASLNIPSYTVTQAISPELNTNELQSYAVSFMARTNSSQSTMLIVGTLDDINDPNSFYPLHYTYINGYEWTQITVNLANTPTSARHVAIQFDGYYTDYTVFIDDLHITSCSVADYTVSNITPNSATLSWSTVGEPTVSIEVLRNGESIGSVSNPQSPLNVANLEAESDYAFVLRASCGDSTDACFFSYERAITITTLPEAGDCVDPTNLSSPYAQFTYGSFNNPYSWSDALDYGEASSQSRHTVCTDTSARDPRTNGLLRTIPEGFSSSVRLGNWESGAEAEAATYSLFVDTASFELLLLHYAAVLQNPNHAPEDQPRFTIQVLDEGFNEIDPYCASADFVSNAALGWNSAPDGVLWKDWTAVGLDLTPYANQNIYIRLTTYDCFEGSHYGYAYFTLECMRKTLVSEACGDIESNTFVAPAGFNYDWHLEGSTASLGHTQSVTVPATDANYICELSKIDNAECTFTISAYGGTRYPMASMQPTVSIDNCRFIVGFTNTSSVSTDGITPINGATCESAYWDFGNGQTSTSYHSATTYNTPGTYTIMLVSGVAGDACTDTAYYTLQLDIPEGMQPSDTVDATICSNQRYSFGGINYMLPGTYYYTTFIPGSCDSLHVLNLAVAPAASSDTTAVVCDSLRWHGTLYTASTLASRTVGVSSNGCDSTRNLNLTVHHSATRTIADTLLSSQLPYPAAGQYITRANFNHSHAPRYATYDATYALSTTHGCDSTLNLSLLLWLDRDTTLFAQACRNTLPYYYGTTPLNPTTDLATYTFHTTTTHGADSTITLTLSVTDNPTALFLDTINENDLPANFRGYTFYGPTDTTMTLNGPDCDTIATYRLHVWLNSTDTLHRTVCRTELPYQFGSALFDTIEGLRTDTTYTDTATIALSSIHGTDSVVTYLLTVGGSYHTADTTIFCPGRPLTYRGVMFDSPVAFDTVLRTTQGCDSTVHVVLQERDPDYRPLTLYRFDSDPWQPTDSLIAGCAPTTLSLRDTTPGTRSRLWLLATADTVASTTDSVLSFTFASASTPTTATAGLVIESSIGCIDTLAWPVLIFRSPLADFRWDPEVPVMSHPETQFVNLSTIDSTRWRADEDYPLTYLWQIGSPTGSEDTSTLKDPHYKWGEGDDGITGDATVSLIAYWEHTAAHLAFGPYDSTTLATFTLSGITHTCTDTSTQVVTISNDYLQFPNLVTPNGDGVNDTWHIVNLVEYGEYPTNELWIYNQWGALVYHARDMRTDADGWDPNATNSPAGTYYYRFTARGRFGITKRNGIIEVVR